MKSKIYAFALFFLSLLLTGCSSTEATPELLHLPESSIPVYEIPQAVSSNETVFSNYSSTFAWDCEDGTQCTVQISLPAIKPELAFADAYNRAVESHWSRIESELQHCSDSGIMADLGSVTYEAYQKNGLLSVLIMCNSRSGKDAYFVSTFSMEEQRELSTPELAEKLLGLDYPSFLLASTQLVIQDYQERYQAKAYPVPYDQMSEDQKEKAEEYEWTLNSLPVDTGDLYNRCIYQNENGDAMLLFEGPLLELEYGAVGTSRVSKMNLDNIGWTPISKLDAMTELLTMDVSGRAHYPECYSYLLQNALLADPTTFIEALSQQEDPSWIAQSIAYACDGESLQQVLDLCNRLASDASLSDKERSAAEAILGTLK